MPAAFAPANVSGVDDESHQEGGETEMREDCSCGRVGELEDREPVLDGGDGYPALRCPGEACGHTDGLGWLPAAARWPVLEEAHRRTMPRRPRAA